MDDPSPAGGLARRRASIAISVAVLAVIAILQVRGGGLRAVWGFVPAVVVYVGVTLVVNRRARRRGKEGVERRRNAILTMGELFVAIALACMVMTASGVVAAGLDWRLALLGLLALPMLGLGALVLRHPAAFEGFVR